MRYPKLRELKEAIKCIFTKPATTKYPFGPAKIHPRYRGKPEFQDECLGCEACKEVCPSGAIEVVDDVKNKKRKLIRRFDMCITCGECERICTCKEGVKMVPEFAFAVFKKEDLTDIIERDLIVCENCGKVIATKKHILWLMENLKEKGASYLPFVIMSLKEIGIYEKVEKKTTLDKRQALFSILCPRCRHKIFLYDAL
ncbi:4Fe-4S dicluster domain-containing protein [candidate division WOR-3 bacterium]|nr:4Fe-4S dicluster domain-containing protein [candidate division WOR-3 bacterium]